MNEVAPQGSREDSTLSIVREYGDRHVQEGKVARSEPGSKSFFQEIEDDRFETLHYLPRLVNFAQHGLEGRFLVMDGERMILPNASFELVYCHAVLHFTPNPRRMVEEIHRVLRPGGQGIIMTLNRRSWLNLMHRLFKVEIDHLDAPVFSQFTIAEFRRLLDIFNAVNIVVECSPVASDVREGMKAHLFKGLFVAAFNALPRSWVNQSGPYLLAFVSKQSQGSGTS